MWLWNTFTFLQIKMPLIFCVGLPPQRFVSVSLNLTMQSSQFLAFLEFLSSPTTWPCLAITSNLSKTFHSNHAPTSSTFPTEFKFEINPRPRNKWQCNNYTRLRISLQSWRTRIDFILKTKKKPIKLLNISCNSLESRFLLSLYIYFDDDVDGSVVP